MRTYTRLDDITVPLSRTRHARLWIAKIDEHTWRHLVRDDASGWDFTGEPFATKVEAFANIAETLETYYGG